MEKEKNKRSFFTSVKEKTVLFFKDKKKKIVNFFKTLPARTKAKFAGAKEIITQGNGKVCASMCVMGLGQLIYKQWAKGILYLLVQAAFLAYFVLKGAGDFIEIGRAHV